MMSREKSTERYWWLFIGILVITISILHYSTPTMLWQYHLIFMQSYFIPILIAAFKFGIRGGLGTALAASILYFPHVMLQWGGLIETNLMRFLQIILFNVVGYITGLIAQREKIEKERFQQTARKLEINLKRLQEQSEKLMELEEQLRQNDRLAVVGELTASLAHEVRNPLGSIRGAVEIIRDELPKDWSKVEFIKILIDESERLNKVVENYLQFAGRRKKEQIKFDVREVIQNATMMITSQLRKHGIILRSELSELVLHIEGDANQLWQVLMNLMLNAHQAMEKGGELYISAHYITPTDSDQSDAPDKQMHRYIQIIIRDQGSGISAQNIEKIYQPFYSTKDGGTGLGLAIVKRICNDNRWDISVESKVGEGTVFELRIPCK
jgi:signal transduction histidine kinase